MELGASLQQQRAAACRSEEEFLDILRNAVQDEGRQPRRRARQRTRCPIRCNGLDADILNARPHGQTGEFR